jgi:hypothetical protein
MLLAFNSMVDSLEKEMKQFAGQQDFSLSTSLHLIVGKSSRVLHSDRPLFFFLLEYQLGVSSGWISCVNGNVMQQLLPRNLLAIRRRNAPVQAQTPS